MLTCPGRSWNIARRNRDTFFLYAYKISNTISPKKHTYIYTHIHIYTCVKCWCLLIGKFGGVRAAARNVFLGGAGGEMHFPAHVGSLKAHKAHQGRGVRSVDMSCYQNPTHPKKTRQIQDRMGRCGSWPTHTTTHTASDRREAVSRENRYRGAPQVSPEVS